MSSQPWIIYSRDKKLRQVEDIFVFFLSVSVFRTDQEDSETARVLVLKIFDLQVPRTSHFSRTQTVGK